VLANTKILEKGGIFFNILTIEQFWSRQSSVDDMNDFIITGTDLFTPMVLYFRLHVTPYRTSADTQKTVTKRYNFEHRN
jgi:hypothetical protein